MRKLIRRGLALLLLAAMVVLGVFVAFWCTSPEPLPPKIRIAAGKNKGLYLKFAEAFKSHLEKSTGRPVEVIETDGTEANVKLLKDGGADLAILQSDSATPKGVVGIAPLFPEPLHVIVRKGKGIRSVADLKGRQVALGSKESGMLVNAWTVLEHYGLGKGDVKDVGDPFDALERNPEVDAGFVTTGWMNERLMNLLKNPELELVGITDAHGLATRHPWFTAMTLPRGLYPGTSPVPPEPVPTVVVTALLAGRTDAPDRLVRESLLVLYETDLLAAFPASLTAKAAKNYDAAVMHPAVANYYNPNAGLHVLSEALDFFSKHMGGLAALFVVGGLLWSWYCNRREEAAEKADREQKQKLDAFIRETLKVELAQMQKSDPEGLRPFLRRVTKIKRKALKELTSESVLGDQRFAIFLAQCAALSDKIQMRMIYGKLSETMSSASQLLIGLSVEALAALADSRLAPIDQARLDDLLARRKEQTLSADDETELDKLLHKTDQLALLKTRAQYTLSRPKVSARPKVSGTD